MNPIYQATKTQPMVNQISEMYKMFTSMKNPMAAMQQMAIKNPQLQPVVQMLQNGANPEFVFNQLCQQQNIDPNYVISQIKANIR